MTERKKAGISAVWGSLALALMVAGCGLTPSGRKPAQATEPSVVPAPLRLEAKPGTFALRPETRIVIVESQVEALPVATFLRDILKTPTGYDLGIEVSTEYAGETPLRAGAIYLRLADLEGRLGQEGYLLDVGPDRILMEAAAPAGLFYGVQTLRQLLPPAIEKPAGSRAGAWTVPAVVHRGPAPVRLARRHARLSRHFFPKEFVKRWIDLLAMHKLNVFHWHLTDDQGWRIEIKKYPAPDRGRGLAGRPGGQALERPRSPEARRGRDLRRFLYAGGHPRDRRLRRCPLTSPSCPRSRCRATPWRALAAYPELSCTGGPFTVKPGGYWPITDVFCPGKRIARSRSWRMSLPRSSRSSPARSSTSAATRSTRPSGRAAPSARPG